MVHRRSRTRRVRGRTARRVALGQKGASQPERNPPVTVVWRLFGGSVAALSMVGLYRAVTDGETLVPGHGPVTWAADPTAFTAALVLMATFALAGFLRATTVALRPATLPLSGERPLPRARSRL